MRKYHRWFGFVAAVFLFVLATSGVILLIQHALGDDPDEELASGTSALTTGMASSMYDAFVTRTLDAARSRAPGGLIFSVTLRPVGTDVQGIVLLHGDPPRQITVDARTGRVVDDVQQDPDSLMMRIHTGEILGAPGLVLDAVFGIAMMVLALTGLWVYLDMYRKRRRVGQRRILW